MATLYPLAFWPDEPAETLPVVPAGRLRRSARVGRTSRVCAPLLGARRVRRALGARLALKGGGNPGKDLGCIDDGRVLVRRHRRVRFGLRLHGDESVVIQRRRALHGSRLVVRAQPRTAIGARLQDACAVASVPSDAVADGVRGGVVLGQRRVARARGLFGGRGTGRIRRSCSCRCSRCRRRLTTSLDGFVWRRRRNSNTN